MTINWAHMPPKRVKRAQWAPNGPKRGATAAEGLPPPAAGSSCGVPPIHYLIIINSVKRRLHFRLHARMREKCKQLLAIWSDLEQAQPRMRMRACNLQPTKIQAARMHARTHAGTRGHNKSFGASMFPMLEIYWNRWPQAKGTLVCPSQTAHSGLSFADRSAKDKYAHCEGLRRTKLSSTITSRDSLPFARNLAPPSRDNVAKC